MDGIEQIIKYLASVPDEMTVGELRAELKKFAPEYEYATCHCGLRIKAIVGDDTSTRWRHVPGDDRGCRAALWHIDKEKWYNSSKKGYAAPSKRATG